MPGFAKFQVKIHVKLELPKKYDLAKVGAVQGYRVEPCSNGYLCKDWNCRDFHSRMEQRCKSGDDCDDENCNWIHVKAKLICKTLCIDAAEILGRMLKLIQLLMSHRWNAGTDDGSCFSPAITACCFPTCNEHAKPMTPWQDVQRRPSAWFKERRLLLQSHRVEFWRHFLAWYYPIIEANQNMSSLHVLCLQLQIQTFILLQSARCCPFLQFLLCPDLEREVGKHYIRELVYQLGFARGLHVIYKDDMAHRLKDLHGGVSDVSLRFAQQATIWICILVSISWKFILSPSSSLQQTIDSSARWKAKVALSKHIPTLSNDLPLKEEEDLKFKIDVRSNSDACLSERSVSCWRGAYKAAPA